MHISGEHIHSDSSIREQIKITNILLFTCNIIKYHPCLESLCGLDSIYYSIIMICYSIHKMRSTNEVAQSVRVFLYLECILRTNIATKNWTITHNYQNQRPFPTKKAAEHWKLQIVYQKQKNKCQITRNNFSSISFVISKAQQHHINHRTNLVHK